MTDNQNNNDIHAVVFAACEEMLREEIPFAKISSRQVSLRSGVTWSHTTVTPYVNKWREQRLEKQRDSIKQTQMSQNFVKALHKEVEDRMLDLRKIDVEQMQMLQSELQDVIDTSLKVESELITTKKKLVLKTEEASQSATLANQYKQDKIKLEEDNKSTLEAIQLRHDKEVADLKLTIENNSLTYKSERTTMKEEHAASIDKLTDKNEELHTDLKDKTAECAEANVKAESLIKVSKDLEEEKGKAAQLKSEVVKQSSEIEIKQNALDSAEQNVLDCKSQRDKAQDLKELVESELKALQLKYQTILVKAASSGITIDGEGDFSDK